MSFCLNCSNHRPCQCVGPPIGVDTHRDDTFGCPPPEVSKDLRHPATKWFDQQLEEGLLAAFNFLVGTSEECSTSNAGGVEDLRALMTRSFNAGASYACREIRDVIPRGPLYDCCQDELQFAIEDIDAICKEWLG